MIEVSESRGRRAGPRRGLLGTVTALGMVAGSLVMAQPASAANLTNLVATSAPLTTGAARGLTIAWTPTGVDDVDSYRAEADGPDVGTTADASCAVDVGTDTCQILGLLAGTQYTVTVTARDANVAAGGGNALATPAATVVIAPGASTTPVLPKPSTPTTDATGVSGEVEVTLGVQPVIAADVVNYTATAYLGGVATARTCTTADAVTRSCTISGLTDGTEYTFRVMANAVGTNPDSALSDPSAAETPSVKPSAPTNVVAHAYDSGANYDAMVSWTAPTTAGVTIDSYTVVTREADGDAIGATTCVPSPATPTMCDTAADPGSSDLLVGVPYYFTVTAESTTGQTSLAGQSPIIIPTAAPGAPQSATAVAGDTQATVTWQAPALATPAVGSYRVRAWTGGVATAHMCTTTTELTCTVTGLTNATAYTFAVSAVGATGTGTESAPTISNSVTPAEVAKPVTPTGVTLTPTATTLVVSWATPPASPVTPVLVYTATAMPGGKACTVSSTVHTCTIEGLTPATAYTVTLVAHGSASNSVGATATATTLAATPGEPGTPPGEHAPVSGPVVTNRDGKAQIFAKGGTGVLWTAVRNSESGDWEGWMNLGYPIYSEPVAVKNSDGRLQVFVLDVNGFVTYKIQDESDDSFGEWTRISTTRSLAKIVVGVNVDGRVQVFGRSGDHLYYAVQTLTSPNLWQSWVDLGYPVTGDPTVVSAADGRLEVFIAGYQGAIYHRVQKVAGVNQGESDWTSWQRLAPPTAGTNTFM